MTRIAIVLLMLVASGCDAINGPSELERQIAKEQDVIRRYSSEVDRVDALQKAFVDAWKKANEKKDLKLYKDDLTTNVLPALKAYVTTAAAMPTGSEELAKIHAPLVAEYQKAQAALETFTSIVTEQNLDVEYAKVLAAMDLVKKAEVQYLKDLQLYYARNRVELRQGP